MLISEIRRRVDEDPRYAELDRRLRHIKFPSAELAKRLYAFVFLSDFEFYSHFLGRFDCRYQKPAELMVEMIGEGFGGNCNEKNIALRYLLEQAGFEQLDFVFGGSIRGSDKPFSEKKADERGICCWPSGYALPQTLHCSVVMTVEGKPYLCDPNNGRMGPIIMTPDVTEAVLRNEHKGYYQMYNGKMWYQRVPQRFHEWILNVNQGDDVFGMRMAERLGLLARDNFDVILTTLDNRKEALDRWETTPQLKDILIASEQSRLLDGDYEVLPALDRRTALHLRQALTRLNEIGKAVDGYPRYLAFRIFKHTWWEMGRLVVPTVRAGQ